MKTSTAAAALVLLLTTADARAAGQATHVADLADLDLEQLARITVTSASRREQRVTDAPTSIFVITHEDIRRAGVTSLAEALRLAPNLQVMRGDTSQYVISARGGLTPTANKMLVLVDGRTVYTPLFSGVFYDALAIVLEDVERIEVISGPGSTLWGTNAVSGIVNITTRSAKATEGGLVAAGAGNYERGFTARHGWRSGDASSTRVFARYYDRDERRLEIGGPAHDGAERWVAGVRGDVERGTNNATWHAEAYGANVDHLGGARDLSGGNVLARWTRGQGTPETFWLQAYLDHTYRSHAGSFEERRDTFDIEGQHTTRAFAGHLLAWGAGFRASRDRTTPTPTLGFVPRDQTLRLASLYAQDEMRLADKLRGIVGLRLEHNSYTGAEWMPTARATYAIGPNEMAWAAISRALRSPSRIDADLVIPGSPPFVLVNNPEFESEIATVAEAGYRRAIGAAASLSLSAFHHEFRRLRTVEPVGTQFRLANGGEGRLYGVEAWGDLRPHEDWRLIWGFVAMHDRFRVREGRVNLSEDPLGNNPERTFSLRSLWNVSERVQLDLSGRHIGRLPNPAIPAYTQLSARLGWRVSRQLELSLTGDNLLDAHVEFGAPNARASFRRSYFAKALWTF